MGMYASSNQIRVFPVSVSRSDYPTARTLTEDNILNLIRSVAPSDSFVVSAEYNSTDIFEFIIHGYYVVLVGNSQSPLSFTGDEIYAHIIVDSVTKNIQGVDNENKKYTAVYFSNSELDSAPSAIDNYQTYSLHILTKFNGNYIIPSLSRKCIDGGEFD